MKYFLFLILSFHAWTQESNTFFKEQWGLQNNSQKIVKRIGELNQEKIKGVAGVDIAWDLEASKSAPLIAVIDSGIDFTHPEFKNRIWKDPSCEIKEIKEVCYGKNFLVSKVSEIVKKMLSAKTCKKNLSYCKQQILNSVSVKDDTGHGTHVSGIMAAANNDEGVLGVLPNSIIMPLKVLSKDVKAFRYNKKNVTDYFTEAINFAVDHEVDAINMSVGFPYLVLTDKFMKALARAEKANIPVVVAAGNNNKDIPVYPCSFSNVICVGAINNEGVITEFSNFGHKVDILAPGESILSTFPLDLESKKLRVNGYEVMKGSSQAAPFVTALMGVLKKSFPKESLNELKARAYSTSVSLRDEKKFSKFGLIKLKKALSLEQKEVLDPQLKNIKKIEITDAQSFSFDLEVKKLAGSSSKVVLEHLSHPGIVFKSIDLEEHFLNDTVTLNIQGKISSLDQDMIIPWQFKLKSKNFSKNFQVNLVLSKKVDISSLEHFLIPEKNKNDLVFLKGRKTSFLNYVVSMRGELDESEFFYFSRKNKLHTVVNVLRRVGENLEVKTLKFDKKQRVRSIIKGDYNLDGILDYLIVTKNSGQTILNFYTHEFKNLYPIGQSKWIFDKKTSVFGLGQDEFGGEADLLELRRRRPAFHWIKHTHAVLGEVLIPVVKKRGARPSIDSTDDLLDIHDLKPRMRYFMLIPGKDMKIQARIFNSFDIEEQLVEKFSIPSSDYLNVHSILENNKVGEINLLMSYGEGLALKYFQIRFSETFKLSEMSLISNSLLDLATFKNFGMKDDLGTNFFFQLQNKSEAKVALVNSETQSIVEYDVKSTGWSDPFFGVAPFFGFLHANFESEKLTYYFESRYWINFFNGKTYSKVAVNRESSFPGVGFSEGLEPIKVQTKSNIKDAIFVNSTLLYGDHLYLVTSKEDKLYRPIISSITLPENCAYVLPGKFKGDSAHSYFLNCVINDKTYLVKYPLNI